MTIDETWGIPIGRAREFFQSQPDVTRIPGGFQFRGCSITLTQLPDRPMGSWTVPATRVVMDGPEEDVQPIHQRFFLRFLSAGG